MSDTLISEDFDVQAEDDGTRETFTEDIEQTFHRSPVHGTSGEPQWSRRVVRVRCGTEPVKYLPDGAYLWRGRRWRRIA